MFCVSCKRIELGGTLNNMQFSISILIVPRNNVRTSEFHCGLDMVVTFNRNRESRPFARKSTAPVFPEILESRCEFEILSFPGNIVDSLVANQMSQFDQHDRSSAIAMTGKQSPHSSPVCHSTLYFYAIQQRFVQNFEQFEKENQN